VELCRIEPSRTGYGSGAPFPVPRVRRDRPGLRQTRPVADPAPGPGSYIESRTVCGNAVCRGRTRPSGSAAANAAACEP